MNLNSNSEYQARVDEHYFSSWFYYDGLFLVFCKGCYNVMTKAMWTTQ